MIFAPLALFLKSIKLLHIFEFYSPSFGLLLDSLLTGSRRALTFLAFTFLLAIPFVFLSYLLAPSTNTGTTTLIDSFT
jgi:hypothetical protein